MPSRQDTESFQNTFQPSLSETALFPEELTGNVPNFLKEIQTFSTRFLINQDRRSIEGIRNQEY